MRTIDDSEPGNHLAANLPGAANDHALMSQYGAEGGIALGGALFTALAVRLKSRWLGDLESQAPFARLFIAYLIG